MQPADDAAAAQARLADLSAATWTLAAVGAAVESGLPAMLLEPADAAALARGTRLGEPLAARLAEALVAAGLARRDGEAFVATPGLAAMATGTAADRLRADLRGTLLQSAALFDSATMGTAAAGWAYADERVLQAQGTTSSGAIDLLETRVFPQLGDMAQRLDADGAFLDVGAGVASVTIELCRRHPTLRALALEPQDAPSALARRNVAAAGMGDRIEIRRQLVPHDRGGGVRPGVAAGQLPGAGRHAGRAGRRPPGAAPGRLAAQRHARRRRRPALGRRAAARGAVGRRRALARGRGLAARGGRLRGRHRAAAPRQRPRADVRAAPVASATSPAAPRGARTRRALAPARRA
jgi:hypothetical protein